MGGLYGHLSHLYDFNIDVPALSFRDLSDIFNQAAAGKITGGEKLDGQSIYITYVVNDVDDSFSGLVLGRNKTDVRTAARMLDDPSKASGSMINTKLKFELRNPELKAAFLDSLDALERAINSLDRRAQKDMFGPDAEGNYNWYSFEILDPNNPNVINYDKYGSVVAMHVEGHGTYDALTGTRVRSLTPAKNTSGLSVPIDLGPVQKFKELVERMNDKLQQSNARFRIIQNELRNLISPFKPAPFINRLRAEMESVNLTDEDTTEDYVTMRILHNNADDILTAFTAEEEEEALNENQIEDRTEDFFETRNRDMYLKYSENIRMLVKTLVDTKPRKRLITKGLNPSQIAAVGDILNNAREVRAAALRPIELIVHDFAVRLLEKFESAYIVNNDSTTQDFRQTVLKKVASLGGRFEQGDGEYFASAGNRGKFDYQTQKIRDITTAAEGFTFVYNGHWYKFTGNFAPINQILGMETYQREGRERLSHDLNMLAEQVDQNSSKISVFLPGGFKPPHREHYKMLETIYSTFPSSDIHVLIGAKERDGISAIDSMRCWELIVRDSNIPMPKFVIMGNSQTDPHGIMHANSPVQYIYSYIEAASSPGEIIIPVFGLARGNDGRFDIAASAAPEGVRVQSFGVKTLDVNEGGVSGSQTRAYIKHGDRVNFFLALPKHVRTETKEEIWSILTGTSEAGTEEAKPPSSMLQNSVLESLILEELETFDEISAMAGGSVEGFAGGTADEEDKEEDEEKEALIREVMNYLIA